MQSATAVTQTYKAQQQQTQTCKVTLPRQLLPFARIVWTQINKHPVDADTDLVKLAESAASHRHAAGRLELEIHEHGDSDSETRPMFIGTYSMGRLPAFEEGGVYLMFTPTPHPTSIDRHGSGWYIDVYTYNTPSLPRQQAAARGGISTDVYTYNTPLPHIVSYQLRIEVWGPKTQTVYYHTSEVWPFKVWAALWPGKCGFVAREARGHFNPGPDERRWIITLTNQPHKLSVCGA